MAFKRHTSYRGLEFTSLIDVVFLLLIFFLVSFVFSVAGDVSESQTHTEIELPKTETALPLIQDDMLENLMIQIEPDTSGQEVSRVAYVLWPSINDTSRISRVQAFVQTLRDSTFAAFPAHFGSFSEEEFRNLPASQLIMESIDRFVTLRRNTRPIIEVRAEQNTEFRILGFIMDQCGSHQDVIPQIVLRTTY
ncbi:hypothetical protein GWO43_25275 [candidate division KSB1 bacterium]|nr:hypothetical protein [candidate division KSB1 bacterium]NIR68870.1 hypothetical protein [candidate division KSB1 bacterium]NIS27238.1 hypothetical protein [candidate division KSB1 bacterium]NIT74123.1 hypothetical protein [candidate division KSB1 bacterium]NIU27972.1 hypothetical protein [candidate division KSB1 bacterium]